MNLHYIASLPNPGHEGNGNFLAAATRRWLRAGSRRKTGPASGSIICLNPLKPDATVHGKENIAAIEFIYCDVDFKDVPRQRTRQRNGLPICCCDRPQSSVAATAATCCGS